MLALLRTRRWLAFTALVIAAMVAFGLLSRWQWSRAEAKRLERVTLEQAQSAEAMPLPSDAALGDARAWQHFTVTGTYRVGSTTVARLRYQGGTNGYWVMNALDLTDGRVAWVSRGWIPATGPATEAPDSPAVPTGPVTLIGAWQPYEPVTAQEQESMPSGMLAGIGPAALPVSSSLPGYLQAVEADDPGLTAVTAPQIDDGRNVSYAIQWLLFALVATIGWWYLLRREARSRADAAGAPARRSATPLSR